jgi:hypothetical protein
MAAFKLPFQLFKVKNDSKFATRPGTKRFMSKVRQNIAVLGKQVL